MVLVFLILPATLALLALPLVLYRLWIVLDPKRSKPDRHQRPQDASESKTHLLVILGSGGHTAEMVAMLERAVSEKDGKRRLDWNDYSYRTWVMGSGDSISAQRAKEFEDMAGSDPYSYNVVTVPRAREIHQPLYTAPISSLRCMHACVDLLLRPKGKDFPDLILCNGPATATILVFTSILLRIFDVRGCHTRGKMRTIYVESWARVKKLSLSGVLLVRVVDRFLVQWPQLEKAGGRAEYLGALV